MEDLPAHVARQQPAARFGNADVCLIYVRPLLADHRLSRVPMSFMIGKGRVQISRPGQRGLMPSQVQPASAGRHVVTLREGPREGPIRPRQRVQRAARCAAQLPEPADGRSADNQRHSGLQQHGSLATLPCRSWR